MPLTPEINVAHQGHDEHEAGKHEEGLKKEIPIVLDHE